MRTPPRIHTDPRNHQRAINFTTMLMEDIAAKRLQGVDHYSARREVCEQYAGEMVRQGGKGVADSAIRAVHCLSADECLTGAEKRFIDDQWKADRLAGLAKYRPKANTRLNRFWIQCFGMPLYALVALVGWQVAAPSPAWALDSRQEQGQALTACGRASLDRSEYERRCQRFGRTERSVTCDYDRSGAGGLRSWELPKI